MMPLLKFVGWFSIWDLLALAGLVGFLVYRILKKKKAKQPIDTPDVES